MPFVQSLKVQLLTESKLDKEVWKQTGKRSPCLQETTIAPHLENNVQSGHGFYRRWQMSVIKKL